MRTGNLELRIQRLALNRCKQKARRHRHGNPLPCKKCLAGARAHLESQVQLSALSVRPTKAAEEFIELHFSI